MEFLDRTSTCLTSWKISQSTLTSHGFSFSFYLFFSYILHYYHSFLSPPLPILSSSTFSFRKEQASQCYQLNMANQIAIILGISPCIKAGYGNPARGKGSLKQVKIKNSLNSHYWESHKKTQVHNHNIYRESLVTLKQAPKLSIQSLWTQVDSRFSWPF